MLNGNRYFSQTDKTKIKLSNINEKSYIYEASSKIASFVLVYMARSLYGRE